MIDILEDALIHGTGGGSTGYQRNNDPYEHAIALDLLEEGMIRGNKGPGVNQGHFVYTTGITLKGRQFLERLKREKYDRRWAAKLKNASWVALGAIGTAILSNLPELVKLVRDWLSAPTPP